MLPIANKFYQFVVTDGNTNKTIIEGITPNKINAINKIVQCIFCTQKSNDGRETIGYIKQIYFDINGDQKTAYQPNGTNEYFRYVKMNNNRMNFDYVEDKVLEAFR